VDERTAASTERKRLAAAAVEERKMARVTATEEWKVAAEEKKRCKCKVLSAAASGKVKNATQRYTALCGRIVLNGIPPTYVAHLGFNIALCRCPVVAIVLLHIRCSDFDPASKMSYISFTVYVWISITANYIQQTLLII
jgi:hypothetical protein